MPQASLPFYGNLWDSELRAEGQLLEWVWWYCVSTLAGKREWRGEAEGAPLTRTLQDTLGSLGNQWAAGRPGVYAEQLGQTNAQLQ